MVAAALVAAVLALHPSPWKHHVVTRVSGPISATLAFDARPDPSGFGERDLRRVTLLVRRRGALVLARNLTRASGPVARISLQLRDVWGDSDAEALVSIRWCGNRCSYGLYVGFPHQARLLYRDFGVETGWGGQRRSGVFEFVSRDGRFFCNFSSCAASTMPVQVLAIGADGAGFVDVSRSRRDLLRRDAVDQRTTYLQERMEQPWGVPPQWYGALVPYCADEYRLSVTAFCDRALPPADKRQLVTWGYRSSDHQPRWPSTSPRGSSPRFGAPVTRISKPSGPAS